VAALKLLAADPRFSAIHIFGASAGGNLAIVTAAAAAREGIEVASLVSLSPFVDPRCASRSYKKNASTQVAPIPWLRACWDVCRRRAELASVHLGAKWCAPREATRIASTRAEGG